MAPRFQTAPQHASALYAPLRTLEQALANQARYAESYRRGALPVAPTRIVCGPITVLISASPTEDTLDDYAHTLKVHHVTHVVRVCEREYDERRLRALGFEFHDMPFPDGEAPPAGVISSWLSLLDRVFRLDKAPLQTGPASSLDGIGEGTAAQVTVAIHCAAGLGRAPVLVAVALIELGLDPFDAVALIRTRRRGAINGLQTAFLQSYVPRRAQPSLKHKRTRSSGFSSFLSKGIKTQTARRASSRPGTPPSGKVLQHTPSPSSIVDASI